MSDYLSEKEIENIIRIGLSIDRAVGDGFRSYYPDDNGAVNRLLLPILANAVSNIINNCAVNVDSYVENIKWLIAMLEESKDLNQNGKKYLYNDNEIKEVTVENLN